MRSLRIPIASSNSSINGVVSSALFGPVHGNGTYAKCLACEERHEIDWVLERIGADDSPPDCRACAGVLKPATISFGQPMPPAEMAKAREATLDCDLFLALGSSLVVFPAAGFPVLAKQKGKRLVIINREPTGLDEIADLVIHGEIAAILRAAVAAG